MLATSISASVGFGVQGKLGLGPPFTPPDVGTVVDQQTWGVVGSPLSASATSADTDGVASLSAYGTAQATWAAHGNSGAFELDYGWSAHGFSSDPGQVGQLATDRGNLYNWSYTFIADADGQFVMNYDVTGTGTTSGISGFSIITNEGPAITNPFLARGIFNTSLSGFHDFTDVDQWVLNVLAGTEYTVTVSNASNLAGSFGPDDAAVVGRFSWTLPGSTVGSVPETGSTFALLGVGLGGLVLATRRMRHPQAA